MAHWADQITDKYVSGVANRYIAEKGVEAFKIFPQLKSTELSGLIAKYDKEDWFYIGTVSEYIRQGSVESIGDDYDVGSQGYQLIQYSFHKDISQDDLAEYDDPFAPADDATEYVVNRLSRVATSLLVNEYLTTGVWGTDITGTASGAVEGTSILHWSDSSADPEKDILYLKEKVQKVTGYSPNRFLVAPNVHRHLKTCSAVRNVMKTTDDKVVTMGLIAKLFEVDTYNVLSTINSGVTDFMIAGKALLCYTPDKPTKYAPSAGYYVVYKDKASGNTIKTRRHNLPLLNDGLRIEGDMWMDPVLVASDLGVYMYDMVA